MAAPTFGYEGGQQQAPFGLAGMTVPERIQFTSSEPPTEEEPSNKPGGQYRPMKVPDRITLSESGGAVQGVAARQSRVDGGGGGGGMPSTSRAVVAAAGGQRTDRYVQ